MSLESGSSVADEIARQLAEAERADKEEQRQLRADIAGACQRRKSGECPVDACAEWVKTGDGCPEKWKTR